MFKSNYCISSNGRIISIRFTIFLRNRKHRYFKRIEMNKTTSKPFIEMLFAIASCNMASNKILLESEKCHYSYYYLRLNTIIQKRFNMLLHLKAHKNAFYSYLCHLKTAFSSLIYFFVVQNFS